jgi:hypothetical protein
MKDKEANSKISSTDIWQIIEQVLSKFDSRLKEVERKLSQIEAQQPQRILNETHVPESPHLLGGRTLSTSASGSLERLIRLPVCDICGKRLNQDFIVCFSCGKKLCEKCIVPFDNKNYCIECLKEIIPLSKKSFKVLVSIANEVTDIETISDITKISKGEVRACFVELSELKLITKRGASIFSKIQVSDNGMEAIGAFRRVYGEDNDAIQFEADLQRHVGNKIEQKRDFGI